MPFEWQSTQNWNVVFSVKFPTLDVGAKFHIPYLQGSLTFLHLVLQVD